MISAAKTWRTIFRATLRAVNLWSGEFANFIRLPGRMSKLDRDVNSRAVRLGLYGQRGDRFRSAISADARED